MRDPAAAAGLETVLLVPGYGLGTIVGRAEPDARMLRLGGGDGVPPCLRGLTFERDADPDPDLSLPVFRRVTRQV